MIVYKKYLGDSHASDSIRGLLARADLVPIDSWSEVGLVYEKYDTDDLKRNWDKIIKTSGGLESLDGVPTTGAWGILHEDSG